jgi:hypothetical protein
MGGQSACLRREDESVKASEQNDVRQENQMMVKHLLFKSQTIRVKQSIKIK